MMKRTVFLTGVLAVLLTFGLVLTGCDTSGGGSTSGGGGTSSSITFTGSTSGISNEVLKNSQ